MKKRVCIIVLDSVGIGALPDAAEFGDEGTHTLGNIHKQRRLTLPNLYSMGLGNIAGSRLPEVSSPTGAYGRMAGVTKAKDTTSGHWELAGLIMDRPFRVFEKFPDDFLREWLRRCGREPVWFGNYPASGTQIIDDFGEEHVKTGSPIVYTSADSVFQLAAHEEIIPLSELYNLCAIAREMFNGENNIGRIIARPFIGQPGNFKRTKNRRDYAVEPVGPTILDGLAASGKTVLGIGKIEDIFHNRGITVSNHTTNNEDGIQATADALQKSGHDLIFTNLVDFDMLYGHRNDIEGYAGALEYFDSKLPEIINSLHKNDVLFITADHGCDPTAPGTDHTREYVPILAYGQTIKPANLRTRDSFADLGATVYQLLSADGSAWSVGESFLTEISG